MRTGRELTLALAELATRRSGLSRRAASEADGLLARPDRSRRDQPGGPYTGRAPSQRARHTSACTGSSPPRTPRRSADADARPRRRTTSTGCAASFEQAYGVENGATRAGVAHGAPDGALGRANARTRRLRRTLKSIGDLAASTATRPVDPGQPGDAAGHAFLVMDDDYAEDEFPDYDGDPLAAPAGDRRARVQPRPAVRATTCEDDVDARVDGDVGGGQGLPARQRLSPVHDRVGAAARRSRSPSPGQRAKVYGSAIWNRLARASVRRRLSIRARLGAVAVHDGRRLAVSPRARYDGAITESSGSATSLAQRVRRLRGRHRRSGTPPDSGIRRRRPVPRPGRPGRSSLGARGRDPNELDHAAVASRATTPDRHGACGGADPLAGQRATLEPVPRPGSLAARCGRTAAGTDGHEGRSTVLPAAPATRTVRMPGGPVAAPTASARSSSVGNVSRSGERRHVRRQRLALDAREPRRRRLGVAQRRRLAGADPGRRDAHRRADSSCPTAPTASVASAEPTPTPVPTPTPGAHPHSRRRRRPPHRLRSPPPPPRLTLEALARRAADADA